MAEHEETVSMDVPKRIVDRVEDRLALTEWDEPEEYLTYVMEEVLDRVEQETENDDVQPVDEAAVKDRLRSLGYLNE